MELGVMMVSREAIVRCAHHTISDYIRIDGRKSTFRVLKIGMRVNFRFVNTLSQCLSVETSRFHFKMSQNGSVHRNHSEGKKINAAKMDLVMEMMLIRQTLSPPNAIETNDAPNVTQSLNRDKLPIKHRNGKQLDFSVPPLRRVRWCCLFDFDSDESTKRQMKKLWTNLKSGISKSMCIEKVKSSHAHIRIVNCDSRVFSSLLLFLFLSRRRQ